MLGMVAYLVGVVLFAFGIAVTIALHEAGHLLAARSLGMRVRRYFIGFGPTLWSMRRDHTEYGVKAIPFGGFCDIAGMTADDPLLTEEERPYAMAFKPAWRRVVVLLGGIVMNALIGLLLVYGVAVGSGIPNPYADTTARVAELTCVGEAGVAPVEGSYPRPATCPGEAPAAEAGIRPGDAILAVGGERVGDFREVSLEVQRHPGERVPFKLLRDGREFTVEVDILSRGEPGAESGAIGAVGARIPDAVRQFGPLEAIPATASFSVHLLGDTLKALGEFPAKIPGVVASIVGYERDQEGPMSVVGASRVGGELVERSLWAMFFMMLANLNFFLALFNLVPLPPFDGGHIAVVIYEKIRDLWRAARGLAPGGPVDYTRLMPLTYAMASALMVLGVLFVIADVVNPIRLF